MKEIAIKTVMCATEATTTRLYPPTKVLSDFNFVPFILCTFADPVIWSSYLIRS